MKIAQKNAARFEPMTIEFTFESEAELWDMWHRYNVHHDAIMEKSTSGKKHGALDHSPIWKFISKIINDIND
ncbi:MAG: hypothetical protein HOG49_19445 [Candidatus Scalindua sp.]|jgi:hypothetical protein|nr:hypothetical protein [Candidatus Scalindua sp.]